MSSVEQPAPPAPARLLNRDFVLLWQGQLVSQLGNQAFAVAMMLWTMEATGSASAMGLLMMMSTLPGVFLAPIAGTFADRHSRRAIILLADGTRGLGVLALAALMFARPQETELILAALFAVALAGGVIHSLFQPAISAAIPDLVPRERVAAANSLNQFSVQGSIFLGQAAGGVLFRLLGAPVLFLIDGVSYLISAASEAFIRIPQELPEKSATLKEALATYRRETLSGFRFVWDRAGMRAFLLTAAALNFFAMPIFVLLPFYVSDFLRATADWYGFLLAGMGAGAVLGYLTAGALRLSGPARRSLLLFAFLGTSAAAGVLGLARDPALALVLAVAIGMLTGMINIFVMTLFQITTPTTMRGRVMALAMAVSSAATPLGMALGGVLGDLTGKNVPLLFGACGIAMGLVSIVAALRPAFRQFLAWEG